MVKRLRGQFITLALTSVLSVVAIVLISVNVMVYTSICSGADGDIDRLREFMGSTDSIYDYYGTMPGYRGGTFDSPSADGDVTFFVIRRSPAGELDRTDIASIPGISASDASRLARSALNNYSVSGNVEVYRYRIYEEADGTKTVVFLNIASSVAFFHRLMRMSILSALISGIAAAVSVYIISDSAAKSAARSIDRQKQFITNAGHDLKTPIAVISANMDVLSLETGENRWITSTKKQIGRLRRLVNDLIDVSKLSEESIALEFESFELSPLVKETAELCGEMAEVRQITFEQSVESGIRLYGSEQYIRRLVTVLCDNALKYTDEGGRIELTLRRYKNSVYLSLYNTCENAEELELDKLFDRFYRGDRSRTEGRGGNGIGLAVASAIVEAHGGEITASRSDGGIVFTVILKG